MKTIKWILLAVLIPALPACKGDKIIESDLQVATQSLSEIKQTTAVGSGYISTGNAAEITRRGICWSTTEFPTVDDMMMAADENGIGGFAVQISGLTPSTAYYARAFAEDASNLVYGNQQLFVTKSIPVDGWCIIDNISNISPNSATVKMEIADDGNAEITEYGVCWNVTGDPTVADQKLVSDPGGAAFSTVISQLNQNTDYFLKPYYQTVEGVIIYGEEASFRTLNFIKSDNVFPGYRSAYMYGTVIADAGSPTQERGVCWGTTPEPDIENDHYQTIGKGVGGFYALLGGLEKGTTYYMRAYATNDDGTFYGLPIEFVTKTGDIFNVGDMVKVENGTFLMGEPDTDNISSLTATNTFGKEPVHEVTISKDFYLSKYEITNEQICAFLNSHQSTTRRYDGRAMYNSSRNAWSFDVSGATPNLIYTPKSGGQDQKPAVHITWGCAAEYCSWLSAELGVTVRLPTEAEWEYAARGGKLSAGYKYSGSDNRADVAVTTSSTIGTAEIGTKMPNELGIYDMTCNAFEYCQDAWDVDFYLKNIEAGLPAIDPLCTTGTTNAPRVIRGGSFRHFSNGATDNYDRISSRGRAQNEGDCGNHSGMRVVMNELPN
ncbi:MAG: formylglycine-generating enzyme family protein [Bacteroidales bacterium]|jgi:formylglycine-generating enzyme required for sulfatase activity|nr:formylglycine-generating enzyme family protein [Bacteroidales bacterium]